MGLLSTSAREQEEQNSCYKNGLVDVASFHAVNEPLLEYLKESDERKRVQGALKRLSSQIIDVPIVVGDKEIRTKEFQFQVQVQADQSIMRLGIC